MTEKVKTKPTKAPQLQYSYDGNGRYFVVVGVDFPKKLSEYLEYLNQQSFERCCFETIDGKPASLIFLPVGGISSSDEAFGIVVWLNYTLWVAFRKIDVAVNFHNFTYAHTPAQD
jgi:hypothetical protein